METGATQPQKRSLNVSGQLSQGSPEFGLDGSSGEQQEMKSASEIKSSRVNVTIDDRAVYLCGFIAPILTAPTEQLPRYWELIRDAIKQQIQEAIDDTTEPAREQQGELEF